MTQKERSRERQTTAERGEREIGNGERGKEEKKVEVVRLGGIEWQDDGTNRIQQCAETELTTSKATIISEIGKWWRC